MPRSTALRSVRTTGSWPTTSANVRGPVPAIKRLLLGLWLLLCATPLGVSLPTPRGQARARCAERVASAPHVAPRRKRYGRARWRPPRRRSSPGRVLLRVICGVGFANYDTLYALAWGGQLARGKRPPTASRSRPPRTRWWSSLGLVLYPLGPRAVEDVTVALGFLALSACGWVIYRLGARMVRARRRRAGGADLPHPRAGALLRRARLRGPPLPAARCWRRCWWRPAGAGGRAGAGAAGARRAAAPGGVGLLGALLALPGGCRRRLRCDARRRRRRQLRRARRASAAPPRRDALRARPAGGERAAGVGAQRPGRHRRRRCGR